MFEERKSLKRWIYDLTKKVSAPPSVHRELEPLLQELHRTERRKVEPAKASVSQWHRVLLTGPIQGEKSRKPLKACVLDPDVREKLSPLSNRLSTFAHFPQGRGDGGAGG